MKKKIIAALLSLALLPCSSAFASQEEAVDYLQKKNILVGDENGDLQLDSCVTRAEFAKMAVMSFSLDTNKSFKTEFTDLTDEHWAYDYIQTACYYGLIDGFEDGTVRPDDNITFEQAVKMATIRRYSYTEYPQGYIANAIDYQCLDDIDAAIGEYMTRRNTITLIYNVIQSMDNGLLSNEFYLSDSLSDTETDTETDTVTILEDIPALSLSGSASEGFSGGGGGAALKEAYLNINPYFNTESYAKEDENIFKNASLSPLSTFSIDTDTASYSNMRRFILEGTVPPSGSIRSEELINYFDYDLPQPNDGTPFSVTTEVSRCPWNENNSLAMISIQGEKISPEERQPQNLVFLIDVSGSMYSANKLPLIKRSLSLLLDKLDERDKISIVTYASGTEVKLSGTPASEKDEIMDCIDSLSAGGSTAGAAGLQLAYEQAEKFKIDGNNRIILCTDGDFNVGISSNAELKDMVSSKRDNGIFLSILGFGIGNYKDDKLEIMADNGNGNYYYVDNLREAYKIFVTEMTQTLYTIAKDVKIQVEFNPAQIKEYRLIGYENRLLNNEDFENDEKDAGELGSGAKVTALYELVRADGDENITGDDTLRYQTSTYSTSDELMDIKLRYKLPESSESILKEYPVSSTMITEDTSDNFRFAASVAELGMLLNNSEFVGNSTYDSVVKLARNARGEDFYGFRTEFVQLVDLLRYIDRQQIIK